MKSALLVSVFLIFQIGVSESGQSADAEREYIESIERVYRDKIANFDQASQNLMIELVKGPKNSSGEEGILRLIGWLDSQKDEMEEIDHLADILDEISPLQKKKVKIPPVSVDTPGAGPANEMREAANLFVAGTIDQEEFEAKRASALLKIEAFSVSKSTSTNNAEARTWSDEPLMFEDLKEGREVMMEEMMTLSKASAQDLESIAGDPNHPFRVLIHKLVEMDPMTGRGVESKE